MCEIYLIFSKDFHSTHDFSDESKIEMFNHESYGFSVSKQNGFYVGKSWMGITTKMWFEDLKKGMLFHKELYDDGMFPHWWLDKIFNKGQN